MVSNKETTNSYLYKAGIYKLVQRYETWKRAAIDLPLPPTPSGLGVA